ncbi:uncharacterized protein [Maniola hyperantus]|uniref:uncharacterized protein n=1 Tax=Aphantopus hyperantus TaxID=2795564 RepID=UPI00374A27A7
MRDKAPFFVVIFSCKLLLVVAQATVETIVIETTTELVTIQTDIPKSDVELAMNLDYGTYTTETFPYINSQYDRLQDVDKCFDDYTKCLVTQGNAHPVCAMNNPYLENRPSGFVQFNSYCDLYFDN